MGCGASSDPAQGDELIAELLTKEAAENARTDGAAVAPAARAPESAEAPAGTEAQPASAARSTGTPVAPSGQSMSSDEMGFSPQASIHITVAMPASFSSSG